MPLFSVVSIAIVLSNAIDCGRLAPLAHAAEAESKPNIVLIIADDLGRYQLGCYGSTFYETPNIDRLAGEGMRFANAYAAAPVCSATRASIMTGKYPARLHLTNFIVGDAPNDRKLLTPDWTKSLPLEEVTIAESLKQVGYATAHFGKWHLGDHDPDTQGFDRSVLTYKPRKKNGREWQTAENDAHNVRYITERSLEFIEKNRETPFSLIASHNSIHTPLLEKEKLIQKYEAKAESSLPGNKPVVGAMMETLDASIGVILKKLAELNLEENTVVVFYSDNGHHSPKNAGPLRGGKGDLYEGGIRMPLVIRWPAEIKAGGECDEVVISNDFFPTFNDIAGVQFPAESIDGVSFLPVLKDPGARLDRKAIHWHFPHYHGAGIGPQGAIRSGPYKLIEWFEKSVDDEPDAFELYDLLEDPGEQENRVESLPDIADKLKEALRVWRERVGAQTMSKREP